MRRRKNRARPTPKWLLTRDEVGKARCLMVLSVLSGEKPVTRAIREAGISRGTYYQLETRALEAMLRALGPKTLAQRSSKTRILELESKLKRLEQSKRRTERLLHLTRKLVKAAPALMRGRRTSSTGPGRSLLRASTSEKTKASVSIPAPIGEVVP